MTPNALPATGFNVNMFPKADTHVLVPVIGYSRISII